MLGRGKLWRQVIFNPRCHDRPQVAGIAIYRKLTEILTRHRNGVGLKCIEAAQGFQPLNQRSIAGDIGEREVCARRIVENFMKVLNHIVQVALKGIPRPAAGAVEGDGIPEGSEIRVVLVHLGKNCRKVPAKAVSGYVQGRPKWQQFVVQQPLEIFFHRIHLGKGEAQGSDSKNIRLIGISLAIPALAPRAELGGSDCQGVFIRQRSIFIAKTNEGCRKSCVSQHLLTIEKKTLVVLVINRRP